MCLCVVCLCLSVCLLCFVRFRVCLCWCCWLFVSDVVLFCCVLFLVCVCFLFGVGSWFVVIVLL